MKGALRTAIVIAAVYMLLGGLWIYFSDAALKTMVDDLATMRMLQTWKGWGYVFVTGLLVFATSWWVVSRRNDLIARLESLAFCHPLTGLPSRSATQSLVADAVERADREGAGVAVVQIDLDRFGTINESFGHEVGDELLLSVSRQLNEILGDEVGIGHLRADEFIIIFGDVMDRALVGEGIERVRQALAHPFSVGSFSEVYVSASMGVTLYPDDAASASQLLRYSDAALARAKGKGPGTIERFNTRMLEQARRRLQIDASLRSALERDELELHFQPIYVAGEELQVAGLEALLRWQPPGELAMSPSEFIPVAEQSGLILDLGVWVIDRACASIAEWKAAGLSPPPVSINLSIRQFMAPGLLAQISAALDRHHLPRSCLVLELTESLLMEQGEAGRNVLEALRADGLRIALDDFGTGYSSLSYLRDLPIDILKIDRSFVGNLERGQSDRNLVAAIVSLARLFGLKVIAEGVETSTQRDLLGELDCRRYQGFLFSKPMPADEIHSLLKSQPVESCQEPDGQ